MRYEPTPGFNPFKRQLQRKDSQVDLDDKGKLD
jgi:hypothetical protein